MKEKKIHALTRIKAAVGGAIAGWIGGGITLADGGFWSKWFGMRWMRIAQVSFSIKE